MGRSPLGLVVVCGAASREGGDMLLIFTGCSNQISSVGGKLQEVEETTQVVAL